MRSVDPRAATSGGHTNLRAKVEHPFHVIKNLFRHKKTCYKGLAKNEAQLFSLFVSNWSPHLESLRGCREHASTSQLRWTPWKSPNPLPAVATART